MEKKPIVSAVIANRNGAEHLRVCLPSLRAQTYPSLEILVADNASTDASAEVTRANGARWVPLEANLGLAPALNRGAAEASGDFLVFLNNDMRFDPHFVEKLAEPLLTDEEIFAADALQYSWDGGAVGHCATQLGKKPSPNGLSVKLVSGLYLNQKEANDTTPAFMGSAASMMVRKSLFRSIGKFDERLPLGYEDVEICWRAWILGWKVVYVPQAFCWHRVGSTTRTAEGNRMLFRGVLKGRLVTATKLLPARYSFAAWLVSLAGVGKDLGQLRWRNAGARIGTLFETAGCVPKLLREKKELFAAGGFTPESHLEWMLRGASKAAPLPGQPSVAPGAPNVEREYWVK